MRTTSTLVAQDAARMAAKRGNQPGARPTAVMPTRRDNILAARSDGTFEAKRLAYNQSGQATGHSMDEAGNITAPAPTAVKPGGKLIPGNSPGSSIWQPDTPGSQSGQPSQSSPSVLPPTLKRPAAPRPTGLIDGQPAADTLAGLKTAQGQVPRQTARNAEAPPALQLPTVASAITPPVTSNVTHNVTSPVTPASPSRPGGMMGAAALAAQGMQTAMTSTNPLAVLPRAAAINQTLQQRAATPSTTTPAGVPAPAPTFTGQQADRYNTAMASVSGANAPKLAAPPAPAPTPPPTIANNSQPPQTPPAPGYFAQKAADNPGGIISKGIEAAGMLKNSLQTGAQNITAAAQAIAPVAVAPLRRLQQAGQTAVKTITSGIQAQTKKNPQGFLNRLTGAQPSQVITPKTLATRPTAQRSQLALGR